MMYESSSVNQVQLHSHKQGVKTHVHHLESTAPEEVE